MIEVIGSNFDPENDLLGAETKESDMIEVIGSKFDLDEDDCLGTEGDFYPNITLGLWLNMSGAGQYTKSDEELAKEMSKYIQTDESQDELMKKFNNVSPEF
ncbi:hypothetical protein HK100_004384 [Physocladia obscura]|uniref:Uncharacterized protein n=1 Tax=Physocladia obscura TaxID=109957 RepID=A0AAD5X8S7_9FUNG|nr:hypothetical protein HK100_004384 [Physocladia obscura]